MIQGREVSEKRQDELVLRLTIEHLLRTGEWPQLADVHRQIYQDRGQSADVREAAKRLAPHPFFSTYADLSETFAPALWVLARVEEATPLLDAVLVFIDHACKKYLDASGHTEVRDVELVELGVERRLANAVRRLSDGVPFLTAGGGSGPDGWYVTVSDDVVRWQGVATREDLLARLQQIEEQRQSEYAAMARAKERLVRGESEPTAGAGSKNVSAAAHLRPTRHDEAIALSLGTGIEAGIAESDFPPTRSGMPDLSSLYATNVLPMILNMTFRGIGPTSHAALAYTSGFVRLVDKTVREYELARLAFEQYLTSGSETLSLYFRAADHLENCLGSVRRAIRYARRLHRDPNATGIERQSLPTDADERRVACFRNAAEHADEQVAKGTLQAGDPIITMMHNTSFVLGAAEESYEWLAGLLERLHALASQIISGGAAEQ